MSYAAQSIERIDQKDLMVNRTVSHNLERLDYLEGGSEEVSPDQGTHRNNTARTMLERESQSQDFSAFVDQFTSQDNFDPRLLRSRQNTQTSKSGTVGKVTLYKRSKVSGNFLVNEYFVELFGGMKIHRDRKALLYNLIHVLRRVIFVWVAINVHQSPWI